MLQWGRLTVPLPLPLSLSAPQPSPPPLMSQRPARSTRAAAPVYAEQAAAVARAHKAAGHSDAEDEEAEEGAAAAAAAPIRLAHAAPLQPRSREELLQHTRKLLQWRDEDEAEADADAMVDAPAAAAPSASSSSSDELDTSCLSSMLSSLPSSTCHALYALELSEEQCPDRGGARIDQVLASSEAEGEMEELVRIVRAWNELAAAVAQQQQSGSRREAEVPVEDDLWTLLHAARIPPRHLVTFCFLLCGSPHSVRRRTQLLAGALYLALLEYSARTNVSLPTVLQEVVLRKVQSNVRAWARQDARNKEAGIQKKKVRGGGGGRASSAASSADPFADEGDDLMGGGSSFSAASREEEAAQAAWMSSPTAAAFIADYLGACQRLFGAPASPSSSSSHSQSKGALAAPVLPLSKYAELHSHLVETMLDITRTEVEVSKRGGGGGAARSGSAAEGAEGSAAAAAAAGSLPALAFDVLLQLIHPAHGTPAHSVQLLLKHLLSSALLSFGAGGSSSGAGPAASLPRHLMRIHRSSLAFVRRLVAHAVLVGVDVSELQRALHHFMQHLLLRASDRADQRKLVTQAVVRDLLGANMLPSASAPLAVHRSTLMMGALRTAHVEFVSRMSRHKRPTIRLMALELAEAGMQAPWSMEEQIAAAVPAGARGGSRLSASFADKMRDAEEEEEAKEEEKSAAASTKPRASLGSDPSASLLLDDELARAAPNAAPLAHTLLALLLARCSDASPTVRARALAALAHVLAFCAEKYTSRDDDEGATTAVSEEDRRVRALFAHMMSQRLAAGSKGATWSVMQTPSAALQRTRSAPSTHASAAAAMPGTPSHGGNPNSHSFTFMHTPLHATLSARRAPNGGAMMEGDLSFATPASSAFPFSATTAAGSLALPAFHPAQPGVRDLLAVLYRRSSDDKALVRRAALQALECILLGAAAEDRAPSVDEPATAAAAAANGSMEDVDTSASRADASASAPALLACLTASDLQIFYDGCFDRSLSIRKQASASLTALLRRYCQVRWPRDPQAAAALGNLQRIWLGAVLPLVHDRERTVADKCVEAVRDLLVLPAGAWLAAAHGGRKKSSSTAAPAAVVDDDASVWHLFGAMDGEMLRYFQLVFLQLLKAGHVATDMLKHVLKEVRAQCDGDGDGQGEGIKDEKNGPSLRAGSGVASDRARACWVLLECASLHSASGLGVDLTSTIRHVWDRVTAQGWRLEEGILLRMLSCVGHIAAAGGWKLPDLVGMAGYIVGALSAQVRAPVTVTVRRGAKGTKSEGGEDAPHLASAEVIKKQVWILNSVCAALSKMQSEEGGTKGKGHTPQMPDWEAQLLGECEKQLEAFVHVAATSSSSPASSPTASPSASPSSSSSSSLWHEPSLHSVLFTVGEIVLQHQSYNPRTTVSPALVQLVQTFLAPNMRRGAGGRKALGGRYVPKGKKESGAGADADASLDLSLDSTVASASDFSFSSSSSSLAADVVTLSPSLRAHAFLALGKLMLRSESLAKRCIALCVAELERGGGGTGSSRDGVGSAASPLVQNNILLILCDVCRTHTSVVEPYLGSITAMLASPNQLLRKHTLMVLQVLLGEEYIKMRSATHATSATSVSDAGSSSNVAALQAASSASSSSMFYRYLRCLVDDDPSIRQLVAASLPGILGHKAEAIAGATSTSTRRETAAQAANVHGTRMHMHFVELIYFLNQCHEHPLYNQFGGGGSGQSMGGKGGNKRSVHSNSTSADAPFTLVGALGSPAASKRFELYRHCLSLLSTEQKFLVMGKLHQDVLQVVTEDAFVTRPWHEGLRVNDVVQDALLILASEFMQIGGGGGSAKGKSGGESAESLEVELHELALAAEESGESAGVASGSRAAASSVATAHAQNAAKAKLLQKLLKKSTVESCLPILCDLRSSFAQARSPLDQWLTHLFAQISLQYRQELADLFAGKQRLAREIEFDIKRWAGQDEATKRRQARWIKLDFDVETTTKQQQQQSQHVASVVRAASEGGQAISAGEADSATRRLSMNSAAAGATTGPASTPIKSSSLSALRVGGALITPLRSSAAMASPNLRSPLLHRSLSTPAAASASVAAVVAALATPGGAAAASSLRTPGAKGLATPVLIRRTPSTPMVPSSAAAATARQGIAGTKRSRPSQSQQGGAGPWPVTPSRLLVDHDDSDASTDEEEGGGGGEHPRSSSLVLRMPAMDLSATDAPAVVQQSSLSGLRLSGAGVPPHAQAQRWNVAVYDQPALEEQQRPEGESDTSRAPTGKRGKGRQTRAAAAEATPSTPSPAAESKKRKKHVQSPKQVSPQQSHTAAAGRPKRKSTK